MTSSQVAPALKAWVVHYAQELGFDLVRIAPAEPLAEHARATLDAVRQGYMSGIPWFTEERIQRASDPQALLPGARSIIVVALSYLPPSEEETHKDAPAGKVARYARWTDYHPVMKGKLHTLASALPRQGRHPVRSRIFVDDGPLLERAVAQRAGLGWFGKNGNILTPSHGSWVFLGALITDLELEPDEPLKKSCGNCVLCIEACPTGAIVAPYVIDARRCISYLTIECRDAMLHHLRHLVGDWLFGCDVCQEVCPVNRNVSGVTMRDLKHTGFSVLELLPLLTMTQEEFGVRFRNTPIRRAKLAGMQRNACVALGNIGDRRAMPVLGRALREAEPLVRGHAAWALGRIGGREATRLLEQALELEADPYVREEVGGGGGCLAQW